MDDEHEESDESGSRNSWWFQSIWKKYSSQIGSFSQVRVKIKNVWNHLGHVSRSVLSSFSDLGNRRRFFSNSKACCSRCASSKQQSPRTQQALGKHPVLLPLCSFTASWSGCSSAATFLALLRVSQIDLGIDCFILCELNSGCQSSASLAAFLWRLALALPMNQEYEYEEIILKISIDPAMRPPIFCQAAFARLFRIISLACKPTGSEAKIAVEVHTKS